jgi:hypothetical protein
MELAMISTRWRRVFASLLLSLVLLVTACSAPPASRYDQTQKETTERGAAPAVAKAAEQGSSFNKFFPKGQKGFEVVPAQEKKGFAEYKVNQGGKNVAMLAITDTTGTTAANKFQASTFTVKGYPAVEQGQTATAVLIGDRYQVKVLSRDASFTKENRAAWLEKFDLKGLEQLK